MSRFLLYSWKIFSLDIRFWVDNFSFFSAFEKCSAASFWPPCFLTRNLESFELFFSPKDKMSFLLHCFQDFCFVCSFRSLTMICLDVDLFGFTMFRIDSDLDLCLSADLRSIQSFFLWRFFSGPLSFSFFQNSYDMNTRSFSAFHKECSWNSRSRKWPGRKKLWETLYLDASLAGCHEHSISAGAKTSCFAFFNLMSLKSWSRK